MNEPVFQDIVNALSEILPPKWNRVIYRADYTAGSYSMKYYIDLGDGEYTDCFKLGTPSRQQIISTFRSIHKIIAADRQSLDEKGKWSVMTMMIDSSGKFKADFDYTDISENPISYQKDWEQRYLKS